MTATAKFTARQYRAALAANTAAAEANVALLTEFQARFEAGEPIGPMSDNWNAAHDRTYDIENERMAIERRWRQRNWTWQDHSFAELVSQNID